MKGKVLVAYATKTGSTKEVAEEIGTILGSRGCEVELRPLSEIDSLDAYSAAVIGAPINGMAWRPDATAFVESHSARLGAMPVAYFYLSYMMNEGRSLWRAAIGKALDKACATAKPVRIGRFGGRLESPLPAFPRFLFGIKAGTPLDLRDWGAIRAWAAELAEAFQD